MAQFPISYCIVCPSPVVSEPPNTTVAVSTGNRSSRSSPSCAYHPEVQSLMLGMAAYCPSAHALHSVAPMSEKNPGWHSSHSVSGLESPSILPAGQASHGAPGSADQNEPGAQHELGELSIPFQQYVGRTKASGHVASHAVPELIVPSTGHSPRVPPEGAATSVQLRHGGPPLWPQWQTCCSTRDLASTGGAWSVAKV